MSYRSHLIKPERLEQRICLSAFSFDDEFNGTVGSGPSSAWGAGNATDPNNSSVVYTNTIPSKATASNPTTLQIVSDAQANDGKALAMSMVPAPGKNGQYDSSEITTEIYPSGAGNSLEYGHIEARIRVPGNSNSAAIWPAFWLLGDNITSVSWPSCGEIDVMEQRGSNPGTNYSTLHGPEKNSSGGTVDYNYGSGVGVSDTLAGGASFYSAYHVFALDWGPSSVTFSIDGVPYDSITPASLPAGSTWVFNGHPFYMILDVCEGGSFAPGTITTTQTMDVDYIHASSYSLAAAPPVVDQYIGSPGATGSAYFDGLTNTLNGSGSDIYGTSDNFNFDSQPVTGNVTLVTKVDWVGDSAQYAKGGLMLRDGTGANASYAFVQLNPAGAGVSGAGGASFEYRNGAGNSAATSGTDPGANLANGPVWLKLVRSGNSFSGYDSTDGVAWKQIGSGQTIAMSQTLQGGLADDSYKTGTISTDTFSNLSILPDGFSDTNLGTPDRIGSADYNNSNSAWTVSGGGTGIAGASDQLNFSSQNTTGDSTLIVDVAGQTSSNAAAMAGAMFRDTSSTTSDFAAVVTTPGSGAQFLWRTTTGTVGSAILSGKTGAMWLALIRSGNSFTAYYSSNEISWSQIGTAQTILMGGSYLAGLAVTSSDAVSANTAVFSSVQGPADTVNASAGTLDIPTAGSGGIQDVNLPGLIVGNGANVSLVNSATLANRTVLTLGSLSLASSTSSWTGSLDLGSNDLIIHNGNLAQVSNQIAAGYDAAGTLWTGPGIRSSTAATASNHLTALGVMLNNNGSGGVVFGSRAFDGQTTAITDVLVKYTYYGDANLDGTVNSSDYTRIDAGFLGHLTGWSNGDFNYDGVVNGSDYTLIDNAFNTQGAALSAVIADAESSQSFAVEFSRQTADAANIWESPSEEQKRLRKRLYSATVALESVSSVTAGG